MINEIGEDELWRQWFRDISRKQEMYKEPILDVKSVKVFKQICEVLEQNSQVFILSIQVAESYIREKNTKNQKIVDPFLASATITFICHKFEGAPESLKIQHIVDVLFHFTGKKYPCKQVISMEGDILVTLKGKLPITSCLDDLDIIIERYIRETKLRDNIRPLCLNILDYIYIERSKWFEELKNIYNENRDCSVVFQNLFGSNFYLLTSILITALRISCYRHIFDIDSVLADITKCTKIHSDHLDILIAKLIEIVT